MKLHFCIFIVLSLLGAVLSSLPDEYGTHYDYVDTQDFQSDDMGEVNQEDNMPKLSSIDEETDEGDSNAEFAEEVESQIQSLSDDEDVELQNAQCRANPNAVTHGATIALQPLYDKRNWLGCAGHLCGKAGCPGLFMEGSNWIHCWGEVFQIYRARGPGSVKVGDVVGFYYPRGRAWFAMSGGRGHKETCPGTPTRQYGFANPGNWKRCWGEVFQIYAKGKCLGDTIENHDDVTIYHNHYRAWVGLVANHADRRSCPGQTRPPPPDKYDVCWGEIFELVVRT